MSGQKEDGCGPAAGRTSVLLRHISGALGIPEGEFSPARIRDRAVSAAELQEAVGTLSERDRAIVLDFIEALGRSGRQDAQ